MNSITEQEMKNEKLEPKSLKRSQFNTSTGISITCQISHCGNDIFVPNVLEICRLRSGLLRLPILKFYYKGMNVKYLF